MSSWQNRFSLMIVGIGLLLILPTIPAAQDQIAEEPAVDAAPVADTPPANAEQMATTSDSQASDDSLLRLILDSGWTGLAFMGLLGLFSLVGVTITFERLVNMRRNSIIPADFESDLRTILQQESPHPEQFQEVCRDQQAPVATILRAGLMRLGRPLPEVEKAMEDSAAREMATIRSGIRPLSVVGSIAPLVGLLGTVVGMIIAFRTASQSGLGKGEMLAQGIYMALVTTAAGLAIAIPALVCSAFFSARVERLFREIDALLMQALPCFARVESTPTLTAFTQPPDETPAPAPAAVPAAVPDNVEPDEPEPAQSQPKSDNPLMAS